MNGTVNFGIIGFGVIGRAHLEAARSAGNIKVVGVADISENALKIAREVYKVGNTFADYHDLLSMQDLDAVIVATPPHTHAEITTQAAKAGKHVLCEKPMAMNSSEAEHMVQVARNAGVKLGIGSGRSRVTPQAELARKHVVEGKLGEIYYARATTVRRRGRPGVDALKESKWFLDSSKAGGGALIDIGVYDIDLLLYLLGDVAPLSASAATYRGVGGPIRLDSVYDVEEHSTLFIRFKKGLTATFETMWAANMRSHSEFLVFGSRGGLVLNRTGSDPFIYFTEEDGKQMAVSYELGQAKPSLVLLLEDFADAVLQDREPRTPGEDGLKTMRIIDLAYRSAKLGREVMAQEI